MKKTSSKYTGISSLVLLGCVNAVLFKESNNIKAVSMEVGLS